MRSGCERDGGIERKRESGREERGKRKGTERIT